MAAGLGYKEFATGDVLTAADANGYLASQVVMVFASAAARTSAIASPQEGMISYLKDTNSTEYYSGSAWVAIGAAGAPTFVGASVYDSNATTSISNATNTALTFNSENIDTDGFHSTSSNTSRMTIPSGKAGKYMVVGQVFFQGGASGTRRLEIYKNGSTFVRTQNFPNAAEQGYLNINMTMDLAVADYVELYVFQNNGTSLNIYGGSAPQQGWFNITYLGA